MAGTALLASLLVSLGCATKLTQSGGLWSSVEAGVAVTVMPSSVGSGPADALSRDLVRCVGDSIQGKLPDVRIVAAEDFARAAFPELPLEAAPLSPESLAVLFEDARFLAGVERSGVRFLITVAGRTTQPLLEGQFSGGQGLPPAGFWMWGRESSVSATVYDLRARSDVGKVEVEVSGRPWFALIGGLPLGAPSFTESRACGRLGGAVVELLRGRQGPTP